MKYCRHISVSGAGDHILGWVVLLNKKCFPSLPTSPTHPQTGKSAILDHKERKDRDSEKARRRNLIFHQSAHLGEAVCDAMKIRDYFQRIVQWMAPLWVQRHKCFLIRNNALSSSKCVSPMYMWNVVNVGKAGMCDPSQPPTILMWTFFKRTENDLTGSKDNSWKFFF